MVSIIGSILFLLNINTQKKGFKYMKNELSK